jgi:hypothetical protein
LHAAIRAPQDHRDRAGGLAVDENFARLDDRRVGDGGIREREAGDVEVHGQHRGSARGDRDASRGHALILRRQYLIRGGDWKRQGRSEQQADAERSRRLHHLQHASIST